MNWQNDISKIETPYEDYFQRIKFFYSEPMLVCFPDRAIKYAVMRLIRYENEIEIWDELYLGHRKTKGTWFCKIEAPE